MSIPLEINQRHIQQTIHGPGKSCTYTLLIVYDSLTLMQATGNGLACICFLTAFVGSSLMHRCWREGVGPLCSTCGNRRGLLGQSTGPTLSGDLMD